MGPRMRAHFEEETMSSQVLDIIQTSDNCQYIVNTKYELAYFRRLAVASSPFCLATSGNRRSPDFCLALGLVR